MDMASSMSLSVGIGDTFDGGSSQHVVMCGVLYVALLVSGCHSIRYVPGPIGTQTHAMFT